MKEIIFLKVRHPKKQIEVCQSANAGIFIGTIKFSTRRKAVNHPTPFMHTETGIPIVISDGLNGSGRINEFSVYKQKQSGTLERCTEFGFYKTPVEAAEALKAYKGRTLTRKETTKGY